MRSDLLIDRLRRVSRADVHVAERHAPLREQRPGPLAALAGGGLRVVLVALAEQQVPDRGGGDEQDELCLGIPFADAAYRVQQRLVTVSCATTR